MAIPHKVSMKIAALVKDKGGCIEVNKKVFLGLYSRERFSDKFISVQQRRLNREGVFLCLTESGSVVLSTPNKTYDELLKFNVAASFAIERMKADELNCRESDVELAGALDEAIDLTFDLKEYKQAQVRIDGKVSSVFHVEPYQEGEIEELENMLEEMREDLTSVNDGHVTQKEFRDNFEEFYDDIKGESVLGFINSSVLEEEVDTTADHEIVSDVQYIAGELKQSLAVVEERFSLGYM